MIPINCKRAYAAYETVNTHELSEGDKIATHGGVFELANRRTPYGEGEGAGGQTVVFDGIYLGPVHSDTHCQIPEHWRRNEPRDANGAGGYWQVQGNGLARWLRITDDSPLFYHGQELSADGTVLGGKWLPYEYDEGELLALQRKLQERQS